MLAPAFLRALTLCIGALMFLNRVFITAVDLPAAGLVPAPSILQCEAASTIFVSQCCSIYLATLGDDASTIDLVAEVSSSSSSSRPLMTMPTAPESTLMTN